MAVPGQTFDYLVRNVWAPEIYQTYFHNHWIFDQRYFAITPAEDGDRITQAYKYALTSNAGTFQYDDPMVEPGSASWIQAYWNKLSYQEAARVFKTKLNYRGSGGYQVMVDAIREALDDAISALRDYITTTLLTQFEAQIDGANTYSDAGLTRATYGLTSYTETTTTALTLAHMEDAIEALMTHTTYGKTVRSRSDLLWLVPENQRTNIARLSTDSPSQATFFQMSSSTQDPRPIDAGRVHRLETFDGIEVATVPEQTSTTILLVHKPDVKIHRTEPFEVEEKQEKAHTMLWKITDGYNLEIRNPGNHAKLTNKTA